MPNTKSILPLVIRFAPFILFLMASLLGVGPASAAGVDDALSVALAAARPYEKEAFSIRATYWGGDLPVKTYKAIVHQLMRGNEYWFWMGADQKDAKVSVHIYDKAGNRAEGLAWQKSNSAAA